MYSRTMYCHTWDELYERYEKATFRRVAERKGRHLFATPSDLEELNHEVVQALRELRKHEQTHRCNG